MGGMMPSSETSPMKVPYRLPVTVVRFAGNRRTVKDALTKPDPESTVVSSVLVDVRADPRQDLILHVPADGQGDLKVDLGLLDDGRLVSTSTAWDARGDERTKAIMSLATTGLAAGAALGGPAGALGGFVIGGALAAVATLWARWTGLMVPTRRPRGQDTRARRRGDQRPDAEDR